MLTIIKKKFLISFSCCAMRERERFLTWNSALFYTRIENEVTWILSLSRRKNWRKCRRVRGVWDNIVKYVHFSMLWQSLWTAVLSLFNFFSSFFTWIHFLKSKMGWKIFRNSRNFMSMWKFVAFMPIFLHQKFNFVF